MYDEIVYCLQKSDQDPAREKKILIDKGDDTAGITKEHYENDKRGMLCYSAKWSCMPKLFSKFMCTCIHNIIYHCVFFHIWYPVWLGRLTHLLRQAQSHWPPFCLHSQLCKTDTRAAYQKTRMPRNWDEYFKCLWKLGHFQQA